MQASTYKLALLFVVGMVIAFAIAAIERTKPDKQVSTEVVIIPPKDSSIIKDMRYPEARELAGIGGYLNTDGKEIRISDLVGKKVILVDFWTYSCINCQRTLPYLISWYEKYRDQGLEIIGVHTPEFDFEKKRENVAAAIEKWGITYPVVQDNDFATWRAYSNQYWPRKYLIDIDGYIVYDHIGEGGYEEIEQKIQELLRERSDKLKMQESIATGTVSPAQDLVSGGRVNSPEVYFGAWRNGYFANGERGIEGTQSLAEPEKIEPNKLYLVGDWNIAREYAESAGTGAKIIFKYSAQDVFAVASSDTPQTASITRDKMPLGPVAGNDAPDGRVTIENETLYRLIEGAEPGEHVIEITVPVGIRFYTFTFG